MIPVEIISTAEAGGVKLWADGETLQFEGPQDIVERLLPLLGQHKMEIIALLDTTCPRPYIRNTELIISLDCHPRYKWWAGGQRILDTLLELGATDATIGRYVGEFQNHEDWQRWQEIKEKQTPKVSANLQREGGTCS
jgi:hypothetical protein